MANLSKKFNAESLIGELNNAISAQIAALQSTQKGATNTLFTAAKASLKIISTGKKLAKALDVKVQKGLNNDVFQEIARKAKEQKLAGAERLQQLMDWNRAFWDSADVKNAEKTGWNILKETRIVKSLAQKQPKP